jgi:hypothetical protein
VRDPRCLGRLEAQLVARAARRPLTLDERVQLADARQYRHDFAGALRELDGIVAQSPRHEQARLRRAALSLVQGQFGAARADCVRLTTHAVTTESVAAGSICLAQVLGATGQRAAAVLLVDKALMARMAPQLRAYALAVKGELHDRAGEATEAARAYAGAANLAPDDVATRSAWADLLLARGERLAASRILVAEQPSLALLVRQARAGDASALERAREMLELERQRGDRGHLREAALLALYVDGDAPLAVQFARQNFALQRELADVRLLAEAATRADDFTALRELSAWIHAERYDDAVTAGLLRIDEAVAGARQ